MQLNRNRAFGTIIGHDTARYEQDGLLFDGAGLQLGEFKEPPAKPGPKPKTPADKQLANAQAFLENLLSGGPIDKSVIFKEAQNNNQSWEHVKAAFVKMNGRDVKRGQSSLWSLNLEVR